MRTLGIAIYPQKTSLEENITYLETASKHGFTRLFLSLLEIDSDKEAIISLFKSVVTTAKELNYEIILDVNPGLFTTLNISYTDLYFFHNMGVDGIRLDLGFSGSEEAAMTKNSYGLKIEINMSHGTKYLNNILSRAPLKETLIGSHNFYPHRYSGLDYDFFIKSSQNFKDNHIMTAAFVSSQNAIHGPWPLNDGICTIEDHRLLPTATQVKSMFQSEMIDTVMIGNAFASNEELQQIGAILTSPHLQLDVTLNPTISTLEQNVLEQVHIYRGEISPYIVRTKSDARKALKDSPLPPNNCVDIEPGDVIIDNEEYGQYKGELQIAKQSMKNTGRVNVIGKVCDYEQILLDHMQPWSTFIFNIVK